MHLSSVGYLSLFNSVIFNWCWLNKLCFLTISSSCLALICCSNAFLSLDTIYVNAIALLIILSIYLNNNLYFEAALLIAVMGFVGTVALSKYLLRGDIMD